MIWLLLNLIVTWYMVGLIWLIQIVHYPLFANIPAAAFPDYERQNTHRTAWVVIGPMLLELFSALLLWWSPPLACHRRYWEPRWDCLCSFGLPRFGCRFHSTCVSQSVTTPMPNNYWYKQTGSVP